MKNSIQLIQTFVLVICIIMGFVAGSPTPTYADIKEPCGWCDYDPPTQLSFCNMVIWGPSCGGNNGGQCGSVPCGG